MKNKIYERKREKYDCFTDAKIEKLIVHRVGNK